MSVTKINQFRNTQNVFFFLRVNQSLMFFFQPTFVLSKLDPEDAAYFHLPINTRSITRVQRLIMETNYGVELKPKRPTVAQHGTIA